MGVRGKIVLGNAVDTRKGKRGVQEGDEITFTVQLRIHIALPRCDQRLARLLTNMFHNQPLFCMIQQR